MAIVDVANVCGASDTMMKEHIADIADLKSKTASNVHRLDKHDDQIEVIQKTHAILLSFETKLAGLDDKLENQISQSKNSTESIINALLDNKKNLTDRILDTVIPLMVNGSLIAAIYIIFIR